MNFLVKLADYSWQKVMIIALVAAAAYYALQFDDGSRLEAQKQQMVAELANERELLAKTESAMRDLERFKEQLNNQMSQVKEVLSFLPKQMNVGELLGLIQDRANQAGLRVVKTDPKDELVKIEFYEAMKIDIQLEGTFTQVAVFLSLLSKLPRLVTIDKIEIRNTAKATPENPQVEFFATLVGYRNADEPKSKAAAQAGSPNGNSGQSN